MAWSCLGDTIYRCVDRGWRWVRGSSFNGSFETVIGHVLHSTEDIAACLKHAAAPQVRTTHRFSLASLVHPF